MNMKERDLTIDDAANVYGLIKKDVFSAHELRIYIRTLLTSQKEAFLKAIEGKKKEIVRDNQRVTKIHRLSRSESFNAALDAALEAIKSI